MQCFIESDITQYYPDAVFFNVGSLLDRIGNGSLLSFKSTAVTFFMSALVWTTLKIVLQDQWKFLRVAISKLFCRKIEPADEDAAREELLALVNYWMNLPHGMKLWILNDKDYITAACGETGFEYLTFQRCLICFQLVMATLWCGILIPIHLKMGSNNLPEPLDRISILNMDINSEYNLIWVHIGLGFAIIPGILLMFTVFYQWIDKPNIAREHRSRRTLFLSDIPKKFRSKDAIKKYFKRRYPFCTISHIRFNSYVSSLKSLENRRRQLIQIIQNIENSDTADSEQIFSWKISGNRPRLALKHYIEEKKELENDLHRKAFNIFRSGEKLDSAFVQVDSLKNARSVVLLHTYTIGKRTIDIDFAPSISDIEFSNITYRRFKNTKNFMADVFWIVTLMVVTNVDRVTSFLSGFLGATDYMSFVFESYGYFRKSWSYVSTVIWGVLIKVFMLYGYWNESRKISAFMVKIFFFLLLAVVLTKVLNTSSFFNDFNAVYTGQYYVKWKCLFNSSTTASFMGLTFIMAFFGSALMVSRWKTLFAMAYYFITSKSRIEIWTLCKTAADTEDFSLDASMADVLINFAIGCFFATFHPILLFFTLNYTIVKHIVDSYCLISSDYNMTQISTKSFYTPVLFLMLAPALCSQALTTVFIISTGIETSLYTGLYALFICILSLSFVLLKTQLTITFPAMADDEDDLIEDEGIEPAYESSSVEWYRKGYLPDHL